MFRIGQFARIAGVTVETLRHYDRCGLLHPAHVDALTGYRHYAVEQLPRLNRVLALKDLGLTLDEIGIMLQHDLSPEKLHGLLQLKEAELEAQMHEVQSRLVRVRLRLHVIEREHDMPEDIVLKHVDALRVIITDKKVVGDIEDVGGYFGMVGGTFLQQGVPLLGTFMALYQHVPDSEAIEIEIAAAVPPHYDTTLTLPDGTRAAVRELPTVPEMATLIHKGPYPAITEAYQALTRWIQNNGYHITGPSREIYLNNPQEVAPEDLLTELQFPVVKA
jgi:DNA-binding transcriptional MerR regulator